MILVPVTQEHNMRESNFKRYELPYIYFYLIFLSIFYYLTYIVGCVYLLRREKLFFVCCAFSSYEN